jgi:hypothetical protein
MPPVESKGVATGPKHSASGHPALKKARHIIGFRRWIGNARIARVLTKNEQQRRMSASFPGCSTRPYKE